MAKLVFQRVCAVFLAAALCAFQTGAWAQVQLAYGAQVSDASCAIDLLDADDFPGENGEFPTNENSPDASKENTPQPIDGEGSGSGTGDDPASNDGEGSGSGTGDDPASNDGEGGETDQPPAKTQSDNPLDNDVSSLPKTGNVKVLAIAVSFADQKLDEEDNAAALAQVFNGGSNVSAYPYESVSAYYNRASYGKLNISADTYSYTCTLNREGYASSEALFAEVMTALDPQIDYSQYDSNHDGYIDGIYIHFAGGVTSWGEQWWSQVEAVSMGQHDGVYLESTCILGDSSTTANAYTTAIHETGHMLGMYDLYCQTTLQGGSILGRGGTLTYDMMDVNIGDINAYYKYLLGWVDEEYVTRVYVAKDGCQVMRGGVMDSQTYASVDLALQAFSSAQCGGFVAISNNSEIFNQKTGLYSTFLLLEYDTYTGNSSVTYDSTDGAHSLPNGFRLYQIQGEIDPYTQTFSHTNTAGSEGNKLIELIDYDTQVEHVDGTVFPCALNGEYNCYLRAGAKVSATTTPSTNISQNLAMGFTGIAVEVLSAADDKGSVRISYEAAELPDPSTFSVSISAGESTILNSGTILCTTSYAAQYDSTYAITPAYLLIDGVEYPVTVTQEAENLSITYRLNPGVLSSNSTATLVFAPGVFKTGIIDGEVVRSDEMRIGVSLSALATFETQGYYAQTDSTAYKSNAFSLDTSDALNYLRVNDSGTLYWDVVYTNNPDEVAIYIVSGINCLPTSEAYMKVVELDNNRVGVAFSSSNSSQYYVIDASTKTVVSSIDLTSAVEENVFSLGKNAAYTYYSNLIGNIAISLLDENLEREQHIITTNAYSVCSVGLGMVALVFAEFTYPYDETNIEVLPTYSVEIYEASSVLQLLENSTASVSSSAEDYDYVRTHVKVLEDALDPVFSITLDSNVSLKSVAAFGTENKNFAGVYVLGLQSDGNPVIMKYDKQGQLTQSQEFSIYSIAPSYSKTSLICGANGQVAAVFLDNDYNVLYTPLADQEVVLFDSNLNCAGNFTEVSNTAGGWLENKWLTLGFSSRNASGGSGGALGCPPVNLLAENDADYNPDDGIDNSPDENYDGNNWYTEDDESRKVHYALTAAVNKVSTGAGSSSEPSDDYGNADADINQQDTPDSNGSSADDNSSSDNNSIADDNAATDDTTTNNGEGTVEDASKQEVSEVAQEETPSTQDSVTQNTSQHENDSSSQNSAQKTTTLAKTSDATPQVLLLAIILGASCLAALTVLKRRSKKCM